MSPHIETDPEIEIVDDADTGDCTGACGYSVGTRAASSLPELSEQELRSGLGSDAYVQIEALFAGISVPVPDDER